MRKSYFILAAFAVAALVSCRNDEFKEGDIYVPGDGEILFRLGQGSKTTKSGDDDATVKGVSIPLGTIGDESFYLEETVTRMEELAYAPETKGTPGFTENFHSLYGGFNAAVYQISSPNSAYESDGRFEIVDESKLIYKRKYPNDIWTDGGLYFFLRAGEKTGTLTGVGTPTYYPVAKNGKKAGDIEFDYDGSTLTTATSQKDILFTSRKVDESEYDKLISQSEGVPVLFHHALTGVKFRINNDNSGTTKTIITKVEFIGLYDSGHCVISPDPENNYVDDKTGIYSSASAVVWSGRSTKATGSIIYQDFANPSENYTTGYTQAEDNTINYTSGGTYDYTFGDSWFSATAVNDKNLNDSKGSMTFWLVPQAFKENNTARDVALRITFHVSTPDTPQGTEIVHDIPDFGAKLAEKNVEWKAGEIRTYTLDPKDVDVDIFDKMTASTKSDLHVTNTGNVEEYVRLLIMGNWYGWKPGTTEAEMKTTEPSILVGYKYQTEADVPEGKSFYDMVDPWFREGQDTDGDGKPDTDIYGHFDSSFIRAKLNQRDGKKDDWADASGGFYYTSKIGPGAGTGGVDVVPSATKDLFKSYTVDNTPDIYLPVGGTREPAVGVHLVMEIAIQAIAVPKDATGKDVWWLQAWYDATGIDKLDPNADRNEAYRLLYEAGVYNTESSGN